MDFSLSEASDDLAGLTRQILGGLTGDRLLAAAAAPDRIDRALYADLAAAGVLSAALPESVGGGGFGLAEQCAVLVELGRAVAPVPYLDSVTAGAATLARFGTPSQRSAWAAPAAAGELVLTAALVEDAHENPASPATTAEPVGGGWRLTGTKATVPHAPAAAAILVPAATPDGPALFVVTPSDPGVGVAAQDVVDLGGAGRVDLDAAEVPGERLVPGGAEAIDWLATRAALGRCALQLGVLSRALELTAEHARTRVQFDRPIGTFQAVAQRLADAYVDVEAVRLTLWQAVWRADEGLSCAAEVATAKFWAADAGHRVAHTAVHVHGGQGIDTDFPLHRYFVAAKRNEFELGGATTWLRRLGDVLAAEPA